MCCTTARPTTPPPCTQMMSLIPWAPGDSYFAAFLCSLLKSSKSGALLDGTEEENVAHLQEAMQIGAAFAAKMCAKEGAFGYGTPIVGRTEL